MSPDAEVPQDRGAGLDLQPTLQGDLLQLRPLVEADFESLYQIAVDPLLWEQHPSKDRTQEPVFRRWFDQALHSGGALVAIDLSSQRVIGTSRFAGYDSARREAEIGWTFLARSYWGGAHNGELKRLMLRHAFAFVDTVIFRVHTENFRSQRGVEKLGAVKAGTQMDPDGRGQNYVFRLARHRFRA